MFYIVIIQSRNNYFDLAMTRLCFPLKEVLAVDWFVMH